jgi:hypothetical protein
MKEGGEGATGCSEKISEEEKEQKKDEQVYVPSIKKAEADQSALAQRQTEQIM